MIADNQFPEDTKEQMETYKKGFEEAQKEINDLTALLEQARSRQRQFKTQYTELKNKLADQRSAPPLPHIRSGSCSTISSQNVPKGLLGIGSGLWRGPTPARQTRTPMRRTKTPGTKTPGRGRETTTGLDFGVMEADPDSDSATEGGAQYELQLESESESEDESAGSVTRNQRPERESTTFSVVIGTGAADEPYDLDTEPSPPRRRRTRRNTDSSITSDFSPDDEDFEPRRRRRNNASFEDNPAAKDDEVTEHRVSPRPAPKSRRGRLPKSSDKGPADRRLMGIRKRRIHIHNPTEDTPGIDTASGTEATPGPERTTSTPAPRKRRKGGLNIKTQFMPINESTLMPWTRPATQKLRLARSPSPLPRIKRETSPTGSDIVLIKSERRGSASPLPLNTATPVPNNNDDDFVVVPAPPPGPPPTQWNKDIMDSEEHGRKPYSHELLHTKEPFIFPDNTPPILPTPYTRRFLSRYIGGCEQPTFCNVTIQKQNENNHRISLYFAKHTDWDAYLPKKPGDHGVAFLCEWSQASLRLDSQTSHPVFVYRKANHWEYCGEYVMFKRNCPPDEWDAAPAHMKNTWTTQFAKRKTYKESIVNEGYAENTEDITTEFVADLISRGTMKMYTHIYECVGYNWEFARWLDERWAIHTGRNGGVKVEDNMEEEDFENM